MTIIALDLDGVLLDFDGAWMECASSALGRAVAPVTQQYDLGLRYGLTRHEVAKAWARFDREAWWTDIPLLPHAADLVLGLEELGCTVWAVTASTPHTQEQRAHSLGGLIPPGRILCVGERGQGKTDKRKALRGLGAMGFLDDHPAHADQAAEVLPIAVWLDNRYLGMESPEHPDVAVIDHPLDFLAIVEDCMKHGCCQRSFA